MVCSESASTRAGAQGSETSDAGVPMADGVPMEPVPEASEGRAMKALHGPREPTKAEKEERCVTHIPFRTWCKHCMRGRAKAGHHKGDDGDKADKSKPIVSFDYAYLGIRRGETRGETENVEKEAERDGHTPCLTGHDNKSKAAFCYAVPQKGVDDNVVQRVVQDLDNIGYKEIVLKSDQEPAILSLMESVKANWNGEAALEASPVGESESNGAIERTIQTWEGQVRTITDSLEFRLRQTISPYAAILTWLVEYVATLLRRCVVGQDGSTLHEKIKGRTSRRPLGEFGEKVWYKPLRKDHIKLAPVMEEGIYVGIIDETDEALVVTKNGLAKARDIRRQTEEDRWDPEMVLAIKVTPNVPNEGSLGLRVRTYFQPGLSNPQVPTPRHEDNEAVSSRRARLTPEDFNRHGLTIGCSGCRAIARPGVGARGHNERCRTRTEAELKKTAEGSARLDRAEQRFLEAAAEQLEKVDRVEASKRRTTAEVDTTMGDSGASGLARPPPTSTGTGQAGPQDQQGPMKKSLPDPSQPVCKRARIQDPGSEDRTISDNEGPNGSKD